jgi:hypothetical protein
MALTDLTPETNNTVRNYGGFTVLRLMPKNI